MIDFRKLREGDTVPFNGVTYIVADIHFAKRGWTMVMATLDGERVYLHRTCGCGCPDGEIPVVDLVTESEYLCCARCRAVVTDD